MIADSSMEIGSCASVGCASGLLEGHQQKFAQQAAIANCTPQRQATAACWKAIQFMAVQAICAIFQWSGSIVTIA